MFNYEFIFLNSKNNIDKNISNLYISISSKTFFYTLFLKFLVELKLYASHTHTCSLTPLVETIKK